MTESTPDSTPQLASWLGDLKPDEIVRGTAPADLEARCLAVCQAYIGGAWNAVQDSTDFTVTRIAGGLTNQLYRVQLKKHLAEAHSSSTQCIDAAIKFYQPKHIKNYNPNDSERLNDTIVNTLLSEIGVGPKVFGIFNGGMIQQFYENEEFSPKHQQDPILFRQLVTSLATVHHLNVPLQKDRESWFNIIEQYLNDAYENCNAQALIDELQLELLSKTDPREELKRIRQIIDQLKSPLVFCHNDFRGSNVLVTKPNKSIILTDAEYAAYGLRGHDLANYIPEWGYEALEFERHDLPNDEILKYFVGLYIEACDQIIPGYAKNPRNSLETIVKEVKVMMLEKYIFILAFFLRSTESIVSSMPFDAKENMKLAEAVYGKYFDIKKRLINEKIIDG